MLPQATSPMPSSAGPDKVLVVPIRISVLRSGKESSEKNLGARADFSKLPYCDKDFDVVQDGPFTSDQVLAETSGQLTQGVHLHWTMPEALRTLRKPSAEDGQGGQTQGEEALTLPNRWRVTRTIHGVSGSRSRSWIIESNRLNKIDPNPDRWPATVTVPVHPEDAFEGYDANASDESNFGSWQNYRYLGQVFEAGEWSERQGTHAVIEAEDPKDHQEYLYQLRLDSSTRMARSRKWQASRRLTAKTDLQRRTTPYDLTIVGYGDMDFASFYPNCSSVFGFCDTIYQLRQDRFNSGSETLSYSVIGWYREDDKDPLARQGFSFFSSSVLQLNGNGSIDVEAHPHPVESITVGIWAKSASELWNANGCLICKEDAFILHPHENESKISFYVYVQGWQSVTYAPPEDFDLKQWHHYLATYDGDTLIFYVDARECGRASITGQIANVRTPLHFGKDNRYPNRCFKGQLAHACIWRKVLSAAEVQSYYLCPPLGEEPDLLGYYPLNQFTTTSGIPTLTNLAWVSNKPEALPNGRGINASIVTSNSIPVSCNNAADRKAFEHYQHSGLKLGEEETGCYNSEFEWFFKSPAPVEPAASLYHGIVESFNYNPNTSYGIPDALKQAEHDIVVGNTTVEAFSALLAARSSDSNFEPILNALQLNILSDLDKAGGAIAVERQLHAARFSPAVEGRTWELTAIREQDPSRIGNRASQVTESLPKLTTELLELVNQLNELEFGLKQYELQCSGAQRQLMADWRKFLYVKHTPKGNLPLESPLQVWLMNKSQNEVLRAMDSVLNASIDQVKTLTAAIEARAAQIKDLKANIQSYLNVTAATVTTPEGVVNRGVLSNYYELTSRSTSASTYYQANEACILLSGPGLETPPSYRNCSERSDGFLECGTEVPLNLPANSEFKPPISAVIPSESFDKAAGLALSSHIQALERLACLVATQKQYSAVCSPQIMVTKKEDIENCWLPLLMDWEATVRPLKFPALQNNLLVYEADELTRKFNWNQEGTDLKENKSPNVLSGQHGFISLKNRLQLAAGVAVSLQNQINILIEKTDDPNSQLACKLKKLRQELSEMKLLSQVLAGFNQALLMRAETMQLVVWDPIFDPGTGDQDRIINVQSAVAAETSLGEKASGVFCPLRGGRMQLAIKVIDCFGRTLALQQSTDQQGQIRTGFIVAQSLTPADEIVSLNRYINLPPRLVPPTRLHYNWICPQTLQRFINSRDVNPLLGWIIYNYLENSLDVYEADGGSIGSIFVVDRDGQLELLSQGQPGSASWTQPMATANPILAEIVAMLAKQNASYLQAFFEMLNNATQLTPSEVGNASNVSVLLGKPLALVSAYLKLECNGHAFPLSQGWQEIRASSESLPPPNMLEARNGQALNPIGCPIHLGQENSVDDGLIGFFKHRGSSDEHRIDTSCFYSQSASSSVNTSNSGSRIVQPKIHDLVLSTDPKHFQLVTMLIDPYKQVHLTSGVLPVQSLQVSQEYLSAAIENMKSTFLLTPLISPPSFVDVQPEPSASPPMPIVRKQPMPTPSVSLTNGKWSWLQPEGTSTNTEVTWEEYEPTDIGCEVGVNFSPQTIHEGWLVLSHARKQNSHGQSRSPSTGFIPPEPVCPAEVFCQLNPNATDTMA